MSEIDNGSYLERARATGASDSVIAALDLLVDDGMDPSIAASLVAACHRDGRDAEEFARHLLKLRRAVRAPGGTS